MLYMPQSRQHIAPKEVDLLWQDCKWVLRCMKDCREWSGRGVGSVRTHQGAENVLEVVHSKVDVGIGWLGLLPTTLAPVWADSHVHRERCNVTPDLYMQPQK